MCVYTYISFSDKARREPPSRTRLSLSDAFSGARRRACGEPTYYMLLLLLVVVVVVSLCLSVLLVLMLSSLSLSLSTSV